VLLGAALVGAAVAVAGIFGSMSSPTAHLAGPCKQPRLPGGDSTGLVGLGFSVTVGEPPPSPTSLAAFARRREAFDAVPPSDVLSFGHDPLLLGESRRVARSASGVCLFAIPKVGGDICLLAFDVALSCAPSSLTAPTALGAAYNKRGAHYSVLIYGLAPDGVDAVALRDNEHYYLADAGDNGFVITVPDTTTEPADLLDRIESVHSFS
jgi:hypothetical protein